LYDGVTRTVHPVPFPRRSRPHSSIRRSKSTQNCIAIILRDPIWGIINNKENSSRHFLAHRACEHEPTVQWAKSRPFSCPDASSAAAGRRRREGGTSSPSIEESGLRRGSFFFLSFFFARERGSSRAEGWAVRPHHSRLE